MKAGRELDALIAEKVMGKSLPYNLHEMEAMARRTKAGAELVDRMVPHYSTQIADAWLVMEKMSFEFTEVDIFGHEIERWTCCFHGHLHDLDKDGLAYADTAPLAICLAALKTKENDDGACN